MPDALVSMRTEKGIVVLELCDPPANTYSYEMMQEFDAAILKARMDETVHVLVLRGAGRSGSRGWWGGGRRSS